jgi:homoserine/homoserine lactone efflux protein
MTRRVTLAPQMTFSTWLAFLLTELVLCLTPGPAVLFVVSHGLRYGTRKSLWANLGILTGNAFYFALSAIGLGAILLASHTLFSVIKYVGAAYLIVLGLLTAFGKGAALVASNGAESDVRGLHILGRGIVLQAANPKALVFFTALLPQFVDPHASIPMQMLLLGVTSTVAEFFVLAGYGLLAGRASNVLAQPRFVRGTNLASGTLLVAAGTGLALRR